MKKILLFLMLFVGIITLVNSQTPQSFSYQAVVRDVLGAVIETQNVSIRISILKGSSSGISVYSEEHFVTTNQFGLVNLEIGSGTVLSGDFSTINWGVDIYFLQTEIDVTGGTNYQLMGVSHLVSVPYALFAQSSADSSLWEKNVNDIYYDMGNVGVGTITPNGRLQVNSDTAASINDVIFSVLNASGDTVFAVYQEGVRIWVSDDTTGAKANGSRGGFAVGGFNPAKSTTNEYFRVSPDSVRIYIKETTTAPAVGSRGGFAVGGYNPAKSQTDYYFNIEYNNFPEVINSKARILWYPFREAFRAGRVLITDVDSVGINSFATGFESKAIGNYSQAFGYQARAFGNNSTAIGYYANVDGSNSYAFGNYATVKDSGSYAIGTGALATGLRSFALGSSGVDSIGVAISATKATGDYSYAFGLGSVANAQGAFAFGIEDTASGNNSLAMGYQTKTLYRFATAMGWKTTASGHASTAMGWNTLASGPYSTAMGVETVASSHYSTAMGWKTTASEYVSTAMGYTTTASGWFSTAMGNNTLASADNSMSTGRNTIASGLNSTAMGYTTTASGDYSTAIGNNSIANNSNAIAMGAFTTASGTYSTAMGVFTIASGDYSIAIGYDNEARNLYSTAIGYKTIANGNYATSMGNFTEASGLYSTAIGQRTNASGSASFAGNYQTIARSYAETVFGRYNDTTLSTSQTGWTTTNPLFIIGNGLSDLNRHNAVMVLKNGEVYFPDVYSDAVGATNLDLYIGSNGKIGYLSSSKRYKKKITNMESIEWLYKLRPVNYTYKNDKTNIKQYGLIAEEVEKINPLYVSYNENGKVETVRYSQFVSPILKALQDQRAKIKQLELNSNDYRNEINELKSEMKKMKNILNQTVKVDGLKQRLDSPNKN